MYHLGLLHDSRLCTVRYTYRTLQGVLITILWSLRGLSERVSYSDYGAGCKIRTGFEPQ